MIELHGWLTIWETHEDEDTYSPKELDSINQKIRQIISENDCDITLQHRNGMTFLDTLFCANHRTKEVEEIIQIYRSISEVATGSYGVMYIHDDEDKQYYNQFQKYLFRKGSCIFSQDEDFSPCVPTIED